MMAVNREWRDRLQATPKQIDSVGKNKNFQDEKEKPSKCKIFSTVEKEKS